MLRFTVAAFAAIIGMSVAGVFTGTPESLAHEQRTVNENYEFVVGWLNEPALAYEPNGLSLRITLFPDGVPAEESEGAEAEGQPVEGLEETLQAEIIAGGGAEVRQLTLEPAFNDPGHYESVIIPTVAGDYTFRIFGELEGQEIDESFSSGPETFSVIEEVSPLQFPEVLQAPAPEGDASSSESPSSDSNSSSSDDTARILAIVGIIVGVIGLGTGVVVLATRRS
jgi:hypothetical protein